MFGVDNTGSALDTVAHIIQVALTPVFLLSGIATLLNVFSTRLARVADRVEAVSKALEGADATLAKSLSAQLVHLHRRSLALDVAVVLGAIGGATCAAVLALFVGAQAQELRQTPARRAISPHPLTTSDVYRRTRNLK